MPVKLFAIIIFLFFSLSVRCQQWRPAEKPGLPVIIKTASGDTITFPGIETAAEFPGGAAGWKTYLREHLNANVPLENKAPAGTYKVIVKFIIMKDGNLAEIVADTKHGYGMEKEVIRIIQKGPKWIPATQNGKPINSYRRQPVIFVVR